MNRKLGSVFRRMCCRSLLGMRKSAAHLLAVLTFPVRNRFSASVRRILAKRNIRLLLVFGLSRSGTTFLAEALTLENEEAVKLHEPVKKLLRLSYIGHRWPIGRRRGILELGIRIRANSLEGASAGLHRRSGGSSCIKPASLYQANFHVRLRCRGRRSHRRLGRFHQPAPLRKIRQPDASTCPDSKRSAPGRESVRGNGARTGRSARELQARVRGSSGLGLAQIRGPLR